MKRTISLLLISLLPITQAKAGPGQSFQEIAHTFRSRIIEIFSGVGDFFDHASAILASQSPTGSAW